MARIVKKEEYDARRNQILDAAQRLVYTKGYEQTTIQDILNGLQISKGAFYHYFASKGEVLEALAERMVDEVEPLLNAIVHDPQLPAHEKLRVYFDTALQWKTARKDAMLALLRTWYTDDNAIVRQKVFASTVKRVMPLLTEIIRQGNQEGVFNTPYPEHACQAIIYLMQGNGDAISDLLLSEAHNPDAPQRMEAILAAYTDALERVLGAPRGCLKIADIDTLKEWFV